jgi:hypothetical protein
MKGLYEDSIRYYVRAVAMNPKADNAWQYLRISLRYASIVYFIYNLFTTRGADFNQLTCASIFNQ